jgi:hypothetical protein
LPVGLAVATALALTGCGGGSSVSKPQYIARVNALCLKEQRLMGGLAATQNKFKALVEASNRQRERTLAEIEAVPVPSANAISPEWLSLRRSALAAAKEFAALGYEGPQTRLTPADAAKLRAANRAYFHANDGAAAIARAYGLTNCVRFAAS